MISALCSLIGRSVEFLTEYSAPDEAEQGLPKDLELTWFLRLWLGGGGYQHEPNISS